LLSGKFPERHGIISNNFFNPRTTEQFFAGNVICTEHSYWYSAELIWETARKNNIKTASVMLPCFDFKSDFMNPTYKINPDENLTLKFRINQIINYLKMPDDFRPRLITCYFGNIDEAGHKFGPESEEYKNEIRQFDTALGNLMDSISANKLNDRTDILILSPYGMSNLIHFQTISLDKLREFKSLKILNSGTFAFVYGKQNEIDSSVISLESQRTMIDCYRRNDIPDSFKIKLNPNAPDLLITAKPGWLLDEDNKIRNSDLKGIHGYFYDNSDMSGFFMAHGPSFKQNYKVGIVRLVDLYPLICDILELSYFPDIDGSIDNIKDILK
jgi:predicted AlkP superfamily pyrophosphatase or phosphodiesterase